MQGSEELRLFVEVGVALVGLIAIFLVLVGRDGRFTMAESFHVRSLLASGAALVSLALLPLVLHLYIDNAATVWRTSSGIAFGVGLSVSTGFVLFQRRSPRGCSPSARSGLQGLLI